MTSTQFAAYIRAKTKTDSTTLTDAEIIVMANPIKDDIAKEILRANEDYFGIKMTRNLVADQRNYAFPADLLSQIKYLEAQLDGTNWEKLTEYDINSLGIETDETNIKYHFAGKDPGYDLWGGEILLLTGDAITAVTSGLRLWAFIYPADISGTLDGSTDMSIPPSTTSFGVPRQFHRLWADAIVIEWKESQDEPLALTQSEQNWQNRLQQALNSIKKQNLDRATNVTMPEDNGEDY